MSVLSPNRSVTALPLSFDSALLVVSECLAEARCSQQSGDARRATCLYRVAERFAVRTGYTELMRLVWVYQDE